MTTGAAERRARLRRGMLSESLAALVLICKGYRILARRHRTRCGEIDLIAVRGRRLAFVEVKRRTTMAGAEASIGPRQQQRIRDAADRWLARNPRFHNHDICFDLVFLVRRHWPQHIENGL
jgi:putative endonuclease